MPAPRQLPDSGTLIGLRNQGWTYDDIANEYGVTKGAVYLQLRQARATKDRPTYKHLIPWTVRADHAHATPVMMLRYLGRRENGETLPQAKDRMLSKWLRDIREADVVVCYDPEMPPNPASPVTGGWYYSTRRPEDDPNSLIRYEGADATKADVPKQPRRARSRA